MTLANPDGQVKPADTPGLALVTGAGSGIGQVIAAELAHAGWDIVVNEIDPQGPGAQCVDAARRRGIKAELVIADVGDASAVESMYRQIIDRMGRSPDLLVNNAGIQTWKPLLLLEPQEWEAIIRTNLTGCFLNIQQFARHRIATNMGGAIVNIGSGCNHLAFPNLVAYTASKGGIEMLTKSAALELGPSGIRVNCIAPGAIETERTKAETGDFAAAWSPLTPMRRIGEAKDVSDVVLFLASDRAGFVTGQTIGVDGGLFSRAIWPENY